MVWRGAPPSPFRGRVKKAGLALPISLSNSRHASSPLFFARPGVSRIASFRIALESTEGARDARGPGRTQVYAVCANRVLGPTGLDTSRRRGFVDLRRACASEDFFRKSASPKASRARCFLGLLRSVPGGRPFVTFNHIFRCHDTPPFWPRHSAGVFRSDALTYRPSEGLDRGDAARTTAAWTAGPWQAHLRRHVIPRPPLPIPCLKMLYRHPRCGMGCDQDKAALEGGDKFFSALKLRENFE